MSLPSENFVNDLDHQQCQGTPATFYGPHITTPENIKASAHRLGEIKNSLSESVQVEY